MKNFFIKPKKKTHKKRNAFLVIGIAIGSAVGAAFLSGKGEQ